jgi:hypothetical protein
VNLSSDLIKNKKSGTVKSEASRLLYQICWKVDGAFSWLHGELVGNLERKEGWLLEVSLLAFVVLIRLYYKRKDLYKELENTF